MELHFKVSIIGKGKNGRTACGSSAYRACEKVIDNNGKIHDYRAKGGYVSGGIELPEWAPPELKERQILWGRHEKMDIRKDASLFREITTALPNELPQEASERVARAIARELTKFGMCVQWDIHKSISYFNDAGERVKKSSAHKSSILQKKENLHIHFMVTMRELLEDGSFGTKNRNWNQYNGGLNIPELLRPVAAQLMNNELDKIHNTKRVYHEGFIDRGIDRIPQDHMGVSVIAMEEKGVETRKGDQKRYIDWLNEIHRTNIKDARSSAKRLDDIISQAEASKEGGEVYRHWDAFFAYLRDIRRAKSAIVNERGKINKIVDAYANKDCGYLRWAGCDPDDESQQLSIKYMKKDLKNLENQLRMMENLLLDHKDILKAHNNTVYISNKVAWDECRLERDKRGMNYCMSRIKKINAYVAHLRGTVSLFDVIFDTYAWNECRAKINDLEIEKIRMLEEYLKKRQAIKNEKQDWKRHKKDLRKQEKFEKR